MPGGVREDVIGNRYGMLTAIGRESGLIKCRCDCGSTVELRVQAYTDQTTFSCGCVKKPAITARAKEIRDSKGEHWCPKGEHMVKSEGFSWKKNKKGLNGVSRSPYCKDCTNAMNRAAYKSTR